MTVINEPKQGGVKMTKSMMFFFLILLIPVLALAAPFLVCDPQEGVTHYGLTFAGKELEEVSAQPDGSLKYDLAVVPFGENTVTAIAIKYSETWGRIPSDPAPFSFVRPMPPLRPAGLALSKN